jgi:hypothetical protein
MAIQMAIIPGMKLSTILACAAVSLAAATLASATDTTFAPAYRGSAYDMERNAAAYVEEGHEGFVAGKHVCTRTEYLGPDGKPMARRTLDFGRFECMPDYIFRDLRNGYEEGAAVDPAKGAAEIRVHFRDSAQAPLKEKRIEVPEPCVINGGVGEFVRRRWEEIAAGKKAAFNMVIPARLDYFRFEAYVNRKYSLAPGEAKGRAYLPVVVEPRSTVLSMLLPTIVLYIDVASKRLIRYQGIVNVADAKGRSLRVRTDYPNLGP